MSPNVAVLILAVAIIWTAAWIVFGVVFLISQYMFSSHTENHNKLGNLYQAQCVKDTNHCAPLKVTVH